MGVVRETYQDCVLVKKILRNLMVKYEERDVFMSRETQTEIRERMGSDVIIVPQVFVEGQHIGVSICNVKRVSGSYELSSLRLNRLKEKLRQNINGRYKLEDIILY